MNVFLANEQDLPVDETRLTALARHVLEREAVEEGTELSLLLVTQDHIHRLNKRFAGDDHATDVLAFPMMEDGADEDEDGALLLGDVVMCPAIAERNAADIGHPLSDELDALVVHGTLHLLGYDHQNDDERRKMDDRAAEIVASFDPAATS
ncbi:MAG TPA: rRNA maturation RNase YbeY [Actinomycetota bacterium]|nr:rRNA maturation RNase YbeY [Actinomycetota bacterium]